MSPVAMGPAVTSNGDMERILPPSQNGSPDSGGSGTTGSGSGAALINGTTENGLNGTGKIALV